MKPKIKWYLKFIVFIYVSVDIPKNGGGFQLVIAIFLRTYLRFITIELQTCLLAVKTINCIIVGSRIYQSIFPCVATPGLHLLLPDGHLYCFRMGQVVTLVTYHCRVKHLSVVSVKVPSRPKILISHFEKKLKIREVVQFLKIILGRLYWVLGSPVGLNECKYFIYRVRSSFGGQEKKKNNSLRL